MSNCWCCANADTCQYIIAPQDCEEFEETFGHRWKMLDDIEREEYFEAESEVSE